MKAIITSSVMVEVDDEYEAATMAIKVEEAGRANVAALLEDRGMTVEEIGDRIVILGAQVMIVPTELIL